MIEISISYNVSYATVEFYQEIIQKFLPFEPQTIVITDIDNNVEKSFKDFTFEELNSFEWDFDLKLFGAQKESIRFIHTAHRKSHLTVYVNLTSEKLQEIEMLVSKLFELKNFIVAYIYNKDFVFWQSEDQIEIYKINNRSTKGLQIRKHPIYMNNIVDVSQNPGRRKLLGELWLQSSWAIFYGPHFFKITQIPEEKILSFPSGVIVKKHSSGLVYVKLYSNIDESELEVNLDIMKQYRMWLNFDSIEKLLA